MFSVKILFIFVSSSLMLAHSVPAKNDQIVFQNDDDISPDDDQILKKDDTVLTSRFSEDEEFYQDLENGKMYQGDIILLPEQRDLVKNTPRSDDDDDIPTRTGLISEEYRWPKDAQGNVQMPYEIDPSSQYSTYQKELIRYGMDFLEYYTCVRFIPRTNQYDYVQIYSGNGCSSNMGRIGGKQRVSLKKSGCLSKGTIMHELIHALGYDHMHSHSQRDKYVEILYRNVKPETNVNFEKVSPRVFSNFGTDYDLWSVMHYHSTAFSKNGQDTIVPRNRRFSKVMGQREGLSKGDAQRINNMYECAGRTKFGK